MLNQTMTTSSQKPVSARLLRLAGAAGLMVAVSLLAACGTSRPDYRTTSAIPNDYRTNHPITLAEVEHNLDIPVGSGEAVLTPALRDLIKGFAQDYAALSRSTLRIAIPSNAANTRAANAVKGQLRKVLSDGGVSASRIITTTYDSPQSEASAPIKLSFIAVTAITGDCGQWPTDLFGPTVADNTNWENFGCATQQNLAAQIANPADLVGPRGMTPIDAARRAEVIRVYREE
jgi:pilus assembly protein CpaD